MKSLENNVDLVDFPDRKKIGKLWYFGIEMFNCISAQKFTAQQIIGLEFISLLFQEKSLSNPEKFHHFMTIAKEHHSAPLCSRQQGQVFNNIVVSTRDAFEFHPTNYSKYISTDLHCVFFLFDWLWDKSKLQTFTWNYSITIQFFVIIFRFLSCPRSQLLCVLWIFLLCLQKIPTHLLGTRFGIIYWIIMNSYAWCIGINIRLSIDRYVTVDWPDLSVKYFTNTIYWDLNEIK